MYSQTKILLVACHWLGDSFWAMQVIPHIKIKYPKAELWVLCKPHSKDLLYGIIDKSHIIQTTSILSDRKREKFTLKNYLNTILAVRHEKFDIALDLTGNRYSSIFLFLSGIKKRVGLKEGFFSFVYHCRGDKFDYSRHLINRPFEAAKLLCSEIKFDKNNILLPHSPITKAELSKLLGFDIVNERIGLLIPGAGWGSKKWDDNNFIKIGQLLVNHGYKVLIIGSKNEIELCKNISLQVSDSITFNYELKYFISLLEHVNLAVSNDNGAGHLVAGYGKNLISIFCGETNPKLCSPIGSSVSIFEKDNCNAETVIDLIMKKYI